MTQIAPPTVKFSPQVDLQKFEAALAAAVQFDDVDGCPDRLADGMRYALLAPGKRLRPQLVMLAAQACGGSVDAALPAAVAVEMIHAYSLVHDDLPAMDDDDLRRGRPTCHKQFDEALAILVGDALQAQAFEVLATQLTPAETAVAACRELATAAGARALVGGQADDLAAEFQDLTLEQLQLIHARKTGALFRVSLKLGALVAGAAAERVQALDEYGTKLGLAFQIVDDLLDVNGTEAQLGKTPGKDARQGKSTFPELLGVEESRQRVNELIQQARDAVKLLGTAAEPLIELANYVGQRTH
ncbi:polyprenyl synthetase family protein [Adhaeretor mobilis]|uniref:Farnesyl diphosphate synthase n=1 Tax=Adhaeretor mobilis TaxID=1930276 RepID=A0A517N050_9BACT|nr:farnesyl diphosphate synthase [Adhaeretor mobilis]QDT00505.1 Farnesyl diphosphate synthase [Adhaeretor mobilis]